MTEEADGKRHRGRWVNLIHETLMRSKGLDAEGKPQPYWPTLWTYIERHKERAARRERLQLLAREWKDRRGFARLLGLAGWSSFFGFRRLAAPGTIEQRYIHWSRARALVEAAVLATIFGVVGESVYWAAAQGLPFEALTERWGYMLGKDLPLPELVEVPAGSFMMGSEREKREQPVHRVTFAQPFWLGKTEVTFQELDACVADGGCNGYRPADQGRGRETHPVINVSWEDAQGYVAWLSRKMGTKCRLPSEAEWEYAARAGTTTEYGVPAPNGSDDIGTPNASDAIGGKSLANCRDCGDVWAGTITAPVGRFAANFWGLHDMHGNVWEWMEDCTHESYVGAPEDGRAWLKEGDYGRAAWPEEPTFCGRVLRGGSWNDDQSYARSANRNVSGQESWVSFQESRSYFLGFRVVCSSSSSRTDH